MGIFNNLFNVEKTKQILGLTDELKAIYINNYFIQKKETIVFVASTLYEANTLYQNLLNYNSDVLFFPMDEFLTSEALAISPEFKTIRLETLAVLTFDSKKIVVTNLMGYLRFLPTIKDYKNNFITLIKNESIKIEELVKKLYNIGYHREAVVNKTGEIAVRGYVVDIFPLFEENPIRIEYWGDEIESIRYFNIDNQLSLKEIEKIEIFSNTEFIANKEVSFEEMKQKNLYKYTSITNISNLYKSTVFFNDYSALSSSYKSLLNEIFEYNISLNISNKTIYMNDFYEILNSQELYFQSFDNSLKNLETVNYETKELDYLGENYEEINKNLNKFIKNRTVIICLQDNIRIRKLERELDNKSVILTTEDEIFENRINIIKKNVNKGFYFQNYIVVSENDLFKSKVSNFKYKTNFKIGTKIKNTGKLIIGDYVVHSIYGIGRYCGIKILEKNGLKKDYLHIQYKGDDKLYIPVEKIELIHKYSSNGGMAPNLSRLNSLEWQKTRQRVSRKIEDIACELLELYAARESVIGFAFDKDTEMQREFENDFEYAETEDQLKVIKEIKKDMENIHPMDRLLCGDVGYGKTEVAFRAIFKAILSNKQTALLCPTTILSKQHYQNAIERFKNFSVNIAFLNRFTSRKKVKEILDNVKLGKIDLLIGTHRILSNDVDFKNLGLLVIDEEQRFGVKHKEKIKKYKNNVDVLTLSATPIPRTLQMSLTGVRNLSLIETPPVNRYPIQTYVLVENTQIIKDAIYKELSREGQIFILYNKINDMISKQIEIQKLVPSAKIVIAHGKMDKDQLEIVMEKFINKEYDILLCTTIIETGIDIPSVNTLIIIDADCFGLSQLYQIRGRVGRSNKIAYCYLMYNKNKVLNEIAVKRLNAIKEFTELGSGFSIAMRDLSIRGAGDILGSEQAGFVDSVGIELFMEMLNDEINRKKGIETNSVEDTQPLLTVATNIDDKVVSDEDLKIEIHKIINTIDSIDKLNSVTKELLDRFGKITEDMEIYMYEELFEKLAGRLEIKNIKQTNREIEIIIPDELFKKIKVTQLFVNVSNISRNFKFSMRGKYLIITLNLINLEKHFIYYLIDLMSLLQKC
ncbi:MAG: transcription-repair coupling factor [Bacilli bacterium]